MLPALISTLGAIALLSPGWGFSSVGDSLMREGRILEGLSTLLEEMESGAVSADDPYLSYRAAWGFNRLELPDSALAFARRAWDRRPQSEVYFAEYLRSLYGLGLYERVLELSDLVRGGGYPLYVLARSEQAVGLEPASMDRMVELLGSPDDSTAMDAALWLSILLQGSVDPDSLVSLAMLAAGSDPSSGGFASTRLVDALIDAGMLERARELLGMLRRNGCTDYYYWCCMSDLARAEGDQERRVWACRRALERREVPASWNDLAWAPYTAGREAAEKGDMVAALGRLGEASGLEYASEEILERVDSLLATLEAFRSGPAR